MVDRPTSLLLQALAPYRYEKTSKLGLRLRVLMYCIEAGEIPKSRRERMLASGCTHNQQYERIKWIWRDAVFLAKVTKCYHKMLLENVVTKRDESQNVTTKQKQKPLLLLPDSGDGHTSGHKALPIANNIYSTEFLEFWKSWASSHKRRKQAAWKRWRKLKPGEIANLMLWRDHFAGKDREYVPELSNFLRDHDLGEAPQAERPGDKYAQLPEFARKQMEKWQ